MAGYVESPFLSTGIEIEVYGYDDPTVMLDVLNARIDPAFLEELKAGGAGNVTVSSEDPKVATDPFLLDYENIIKVKVNGLYVGAFVLKKKTTHVVESNQAREVVELSGEAIRTEWFRNGAVRPYGGLKKTSYESRAFSWASETGDWYQTGDWTAPIVSYAWGDVLNSPWRYAPSEWPDAPLAKWVWDQPYSGGVAGSLPIGDAYFRYTFNNATKKKYAFFMAADNYYAVYLDGQLDTLSDPSDPGWTETQRIDFDLEPGDHIIAIRVTNTGGPAGLLGALFEYGDPAVPTPAVLVTYTGKVGDTAWKVNGYPDPLPNWSVGEILNTLLAEAEADGIDFPLYLTPTFTADEDSYGNPWPRDIEWSFDIGEKFDAVIEKLEELACDIWIDPETYEFHAVVERGIDRSGEDFTVLPLKPPTKVSVSGHPGVLTALPAAFQSNVRYPFFPADSIDRYRIWVGNRDYLHDAPGTATVTHDIFLGASSGVTTGRFTAVPQTVAAGLVSVGGAPVNSGWITPVSPLAPGTEYLVSLGSTVNVAGTVSVSGNPSWISGVAADADDTGVIGGMAYNNSQGFYEVWIEFETSTNDRQVLTVIGHSLNSAGNVNPGTSPWYADFQSWAGQWAGLTGGIQSTLSMPGSTAADYADSSPKWSYFDTPSTAVSIWAMSTTIAGGATLAHAQSELLRLIARAKAQFGSSVKVLVFTEPGRPDLTSPTNFVRDAYNTWVKTNPFGAFAIIDADLIIGDPGGDPTQLNPAYDADGYHPNLAGHTALAAAVQAVLPGSVTPQFKNVPSGVETLVFEKGKNLLEATVDGVSEIVNTLYMKTADGWIVRTDATSIAKYGVRSASINTDVSESQSIQLADKIFAAKADPEEGASYEVVPFEGHVPFLDFQVGDWVLAPNAVGLPVRRRVMSIAVEETESANPTYTVEFDTIFKDNETKLTRWLEKTQGGTLGGQYSNSSGGSNLPIGVPSVPPAPIGTSFRFPNSPTGLSATSIGYWSADGVRSFGEVHLTWDAVTGNTDGTATVPAFYEVWGHLKDNTDTAFARFATVTDPEAYIRPFTPAEEWDFKVRAMNDADTPGDFSSLFSHVIASPTAPMLAPSVPILSSSKGVLIVEWDGNLNDGNPPPPQFRYIYVLVSDTAGGTYTQYGPALQRNNRIVYISDFDAGDVKYVKLVAVDGADIASAASTYASTTIAGTDLGDLDPEVQAAIDAAHEAARLAKESVNMLEDPSFELNTEEYWDYASADVTNVTTDPRTGLRHLRIKSRATEYEAFRYVRALECDPGDSFHFRIFGLPEGTAGVDSIEGGLEIQVFYGEDDTTPNSESLGFSVEFLTGDYEAISGSWTAPADTYRFRPVVYVRDTSNDNVYYVDDFRVFKMAGTALIVDGAIVADKLAAASVVADKVAANAIATVNLQAESVVAAKIGAEAVTADKIAARAVVADKIDVGAITTLHIAADVGQNLNISANSVIISAQERVDGVEDELNDTNSNLQEMQTYYAFGPSGAEISTPDSPLSVMIKNDRIEMLENSNVVSYWTSGVMYVDKFVGTSVVVGNHQIVKDGVRTTVRAL